MLRSFMRIFSPNIGDEVIEKYARKEFPDLDKVTSYVQLRKSIIKCLQKLSKTDREENKLNTIVEIEHLKQHDFSNFMSIRFAYYAFLLAIFSVANVHTPLHELFHMPKYVFWYLVLIILTILLVTMARTINYQKDRLMYLKFKMLCFEEMEKNNSTMLESRNRKKINIT